MDASRLYSIRLWTQHFSFQELGAEPLTDLTGGVRVKNPLRTIISRCQKMTPMTFTIYEWKNANINSVQLIIFLTIYGCRVIELQTQEPLINVRSNQKTCQLIIFERNNRAKFTKICILPNSRTPSPNLKCDFSFFHTSGPKIAN